LKAFFSHFGGSPGARERWRTPSPVWYCVHHTGDTNLGRGRRRGSMVRDSRLSVPCCVAELG
jgi:hypothetical protein